MDKEIHDRIDKIDDRITFINHELGIVIGKLSIITKIAVGGLLASLGAFIGVIINFIAGG